MTATKSGVTVKQKGGISHNFDVWDRWKLYVLSQLGPNPQWDEVRRVMIPLTPDKQDAWYARNEAEEQLYDAFYQWVQSNWPHTEAEWKAIGVDARTVWQERYLDEVVGA